MPDTDTPLADLGPALQAVLLRSLLWVLLASAVAGLVCRWLAGRHPEGAARVRVALIGSPDAADEPAARRFVRWTFGSLWIIDGLLQAQPKMPSGFISDVVDPTVGSGPGWLASIVDPLARAWTRHPLTADAATVWVQVGIGLLIILGGRGWLSRIALWSSILWGLAIWTLAEAFGGLFAPGASWLTGAPGAVLCYLIAAGLLLAPWEWWATDRAPRLIRRAVACWLVVGAGLQALPAEHLWSGAGLSAPFADGASMPQPHVLSQPLVRLGNLAGDHPVAVNAVLIVMLLAVAAGLWWGTGGATVWAAIALCGATWWLGQDFGVLGGTSTDPNTGLPLALLLAGALPRWQQHLRPAATSESAPASLPPAGSHRRTRRAGIAGLGTGLGAALTTLAVGLSLVVPAALVSTFSSPADAAAVAANSFGGLRTIPPRPAVAFDLVDQRGTRISMAGLRGKLVVLTFLDPVCTTDCPLVANQLAIANRQLGSLASRAEFVAIDTNPLFRHASDVAAFTQSHGLGSFSNWHFLYGSQDALSQVLAAYGISVDVPAVGMIQHSEGIYFITGDGREAAYLDDGASEQLTKPYAVQVRDEIRALLA